MSRASASLTAALAAGVLGLGGCGGDDAGTMILATTTSTRDSGLLDVLVPEFERGSDCRVKTLAVGSGQALELGERGDADVLLVHSPAAEEAFMRNGHGTRRLAVMHNDFVLVGPPSDPAGTAGAADAPAAMRRIARVRAPFASRGDDSGTHAKELALWKTAGIRPRGAWYVETGQGMGETLTIASQKQAYTLSDRGTFLATENLDAKLLVEGGDGDAQPLPRDHRAPRGHRQRLREGVLELDQEPVTQRTISRFGVPEYGEPLFFARRATLMDPVGEVLARSAMVSISATLIALASGSRSGPCSRSRPSPVGGSLAALVNTGMAVPTVVVGLAVALLLWRSGPLGGLELIYTLRGMVIAQVLIATPLIAGITMAALQSLPRSCPTSCAAWAPTGARRSCTCGSRRACRCWRPRWRASGTRSRRSVPPPSSAATSTARPR